eukprot:763612-Hanusia_phi.AAC.13
MRRSGRSAGEGDGEREEAMRQDESLSLSEQDTRCLKVEGIEGRVPHTDVEQGLRGLFGVFGEVQAVLMQPQASPNATKSSPSSRPNHERQAIVVYKSCEAARQAIARLQNFAIWGKPLHLSYCSNVKAEGEYQDITHQASKHPKSAPPKKHDGQAEEISERMKSVKRNMTKEFEGNSDQSRELSASLPHRMEAAAHSHGGERAIDRLDRLMLERLIQDAHTLHSRGEVKSVSRSSEDTSKQDSKVKDRRSEPVQSPNQKPNSISAPAAGTSVVTRNVNDMSALSDLEDGSDLVVSNSSVCSDDAQSAGGVEYESNVQASVSSNSSYQKNVMSDTRTRSSAGSKRRGNSRESDSDSPLSRDDLEYRQDDLGMDSISDEDENAAFNEMASKELDNLMQNFEGNDAMESKLLQLKEMLSITTYIRELDTLMKNLDSLKQLNEGKGESQAKGEDVKSVREHKEQAISSQAASRLERSREDEQLKQLEHREMKLQEAAKRLQLIEQKLNSIPKEFIEAKAMNSFPSDKDADQSYESSDFDHRISSEISSITSSNDGEDDERQAYVRQANQNHRDATRNSRSSAAVQPSLAAKRVSERDQLAGRDDDGIAMPRASSELAMESIPHELKTELEDLQKLQERIVYLKDLLAVTKEQQRLLEVAGTGMDAESDDLLFDADEESGADEWPGMYRNERPPSADHKAGERSNSDREAKQAPRPQSRLSEGTRPTSRLSWADEEAGIHRFLPTDDASEIPCLRTSSRLSRLSESNGTDSVSQTPDVDELDSLLASSMLDYQDIKLASTFCRSLSSQADRISFLQDFFCFFESRSALLDNESAVEYERERADSMPAYYRFHPVRFFATLGSKDHFVCSTGR